MGWHHRTGRLALSLIFALHLGALFIWNLPPSALRDRFISWPAHYFLPTGLWQHWGMFAPDPILDTIALEAEARDAHGMRHSYSFPAMAGLPVLQAALGYRHSKFAHILAPAEAVGQREFAARHVVRALSFPPEAFPVEVDLMHKIWRTGRPGDSPPDEMSPPERTLLQIYRFPNWQEARP
jgi:hypothetical protein